MSETTIAPTLPDEPAADSFLSRAIGVFISPTQTFASIAQRPDFIAPLIVAIVAAVALTETMLRKIGMERIFRQSIELSPRASQMSPEQIQQAVHQGAVIGTIFARISEVVVAPLVLLIIAALGLFIVNVMFGATAKFKVSFSVVCYAYLVNLVGVVLALVIILFGDPEQFNALDFIPTNAGFFLNPHDISRPLYSMATSFDVITFWILALTSLGLSTATARKVRTLPIFLSYVGLWLVWTLIKAGFSMLGG